MISSVLINKKFNKETMNIEEKAKEILRSKLTDIDLECYLKGSPLTYNACLEAVKEAINYTHCSTQLKDKEVPTFMFWMDCNSIRMVEHNRFIKENNIMSFQEVSQKYINEMINL